MNDLLFWVLNTVALAGFVLLVLVGLNLLVNRREARESGVHLVRNIDGAGYETYCNRWLAMSNNRGSLRRARTTCLACGEAYDKEKGWMRSE